MKRALAFAVLLVSLALVFVNVEAGSARRHNFVKQGQSVKNQVPTATRGPASFRAKAPLKPGFSRPRGLVFDPQVFYKLTPSERLEYIEIYIDLAYHIAKAEGMFAKKEVESFHKWLEKFVVDEAVAAGFNLGIYSEDAGSGSFDTSGAFRSRQRIHNCPAGEKPCAIYFGLQDNGHVICAASDSTPNCWTNSQSTTTAIENLGKALQGCVANTSQDCKDLREDLKRQTKGLDEYCNNPANSSTERCLNAHEAMLQLHTFDPELLEALPDGGADVGKIAAEQKSCYPAAYEVLSRNRRLAGVEDGIKTLDAIIDITPDKLLSSKEKERLKKQKPPAKAKRLREIYEKELTVPSRSKQPEGKNCGEAFLTEKYGESGIVAERARVDYWCEVTKRLDNIDRAEKAKDDTTPAVQNRWQTLIDVARNACADVGGKFEDANNKYGACAKSSTEAKKILDIGVIPDLGPPPAEPKESDYIINGTGGAREARDRRKTLAQAEAAFARAQRQYQKDLDEYNKKEAEVRARDVEKRAAEARWRSSMDNGGRFNREERIAVEAVARGLASSNSSFSEETAKVFASATGFTPQQFSEIFCASGDSGDFFRRASAHRVSGDEVNYDQKIAAAYFNSCLKDAFKGKEPTQSNLAENNCRMAPVTNATDILAHGRKAPLLFIPRKVGTQKCLTLESMQRVENTGLKLTLQEWPLPTDPTVAPKTQPVTMDLTDFPSFSKDWVVHTYRCDKYDTGYTPPANVEGVEF